MSESESERAEHWREFFAGEFLAWPDLKGKDATVTIESFSYEDVTMPGGRKEKRLILAFAKTERRLILNKTNSRAIADLYGPKVPDWIGKAVTLYPDETVTFGRETVGGIRIRKAKS